MKRRRWQPHGAAIPGGLACRQQDSQRRCGGCRFGALLQGVVQQRRPAAGGFFPWKRPACHRAGPDARRCAPTAGISFSTVLGQPPPPSGRGKRAAAGPAGQQGCRQRQVRSACSNAFVVEQFPHSGCHGLARGSRQVAAIGHFRGTLAKNEGQLAGEQLLRADALGTRDSALSTAPSKLFTRAFPRSGGKRGRRLRAMLRPPPLRRRHADCPNSSFAKIGLSRWYPGPPARHEFCGPGLGRWPFKKILGQPLRAIQHDAVIEAL